MDYYLLTRYETGASVCEERLAALRTESGARLAMLRREADIVERVKKGYRPALWRRALGGVGDALVTAGERLRSEGVPSAST